MAQGDYRILLHGSSGTLLCVMLVTLWSLCLSQSRGSNQHNVLQSNGKDLLAPSRLDPLLTRSNFYGLWDALTSNFPRLKLGQIGE